MAGKDDDTASSATAGAGAATSLLVVGAAGEASISAAGSSTAAAAPGASYHGKYGDARVELVPQLCLLLYRSDLPRSPQGNDVLDNTIFWLKANHAVSAFPPLALPFELCQLLVSGLLLCGI
jgi:hypothetical protein